MWNNHNYIPKTESKDDNTLIQAQVIHKQPSSVGF